MAELYLEQGHISAALKIYRDLVRDNPNDPSTAQRLAEIEASVQPQGDTTMSFRENLQRVLDSVPGAISAMVMGFDGIAIDGVEVPGNTLDLPSLLIEYSSATQQLRQVAAGTAEIGHLREITVVAQGVTCVLRPLTEEYFLAVVLQSGSLSGKARYIMRVVAPLMLQDLA